MVSCENFYIYRLKEHKQQFPIHPGLNETVLKQLKTSLGGLNKKDRLVNVLFDEINLSEEIHYDNHLDEFKGLADDGKTRTDENAKSQGGLKLPAAKYLALTDTLYTALNNVRAYLFRFSANSLPQIVLDCLVY
jgi:hypothetical protein